MIDPIVSAPQAFRLSPGQSRLWSLLKSRGETAFRTVLDAEIAGPLDAGRLERAWEALVGRHEILRTVLTAPSGMIRPFQVVEESGEPLSFEDLAPLAPDQRSRRMAQIGRELRACPLPPADAPLRALLVRVEEGRHRLCLAASSLCLDAPSALLLLAELCRLYDDPEEPGSEAPQYADLAEWQNELLAEPEGDGPRFWRQQGPLRPEPPEPPFAAPPAVAELAPAAAPVDLPAGADAVAARLAERLRVPLEAVLLAAHAVWIGRLTQGDEASFGVVLDGRNYAELAAAVGPLSRCVLFRLRLGGADAFEAVVRAAGDLWQEVVRYQEYFAWQAPETSDASDASNTANDGAPAPEVPLVFDFQRLPPPLRLGGASLAVRSLSSCAEPFLLGLRGWESGGALHLALEHDPERLAARQAALLAGRWGALFADAVARPAGRWDRIEVLTAAERHQVLREWNDTGTGEGRLDALHRLFAAQVRRTPDAPAVLCEGELLTFRELDRRSGALAARLRSLGAGPSARVAVLLDRSLDMVAGLLAVLRSGAAYVPLEPSHPRERLAGLLADCAPAVLLTQSRWLDQAPAGPFPVVLADAPPPGEAEGTGSVWPEQATGSAGGAHTKERRRAELSQYRAEALLPDADAVSGLDAAYVLYTSGSTGRPKAVTVSHHAIANRLVWMQDTFPLGADDRLLQKTPYSFDASIWEIFCPLLSGALLVVARPGGHQDSAYLVQAVREHGITVLQLVPSMLQVFLQEPEVAACGSLRRLFCGGEAFPAVLAERAAELLPGTALCNLYGPTEAAIDATWLPWSPDVPAAAGILPIGRPLTGVQVHLLDRRLDPLPAGLAGELAIGGRGLARGYHGRPDATAERFVPDPVALVPGGRLYRTGDLARRRDDGTVEFLGRIDQQVKIRGFRIELGEIEGVLARHPAVREAAVAVRDEEGDRRLVAYVALEEGPELRRLPNGLEVAFLNRNETDALYRELFENEPFRKALELLPPGACVFDVGANIGLFSLLVRQTVPGCRIYAFEPLPPIFEVLETNLELYGLDVQAFPVGLCRSSGSVEFSYYPRWSAMSGRYADVEAERRISRALLANLGQDLDPWTEALFQELFESRTHVCPVATLSEMMRRTGAETIDLLKIDVEKSEQDVLEGIEDEDWPRIRRIFVELHDLDGRLRSVTELLRRRGFEVAAEQEPWLLGTEMWALWATRPETGQGAKDAARPAPPLVRRPPPTLAELRAFLAERLPDVMVPSRFVRLPALPRLTNGKIDRRSLPPPGDAADLERDADGEAATPEEELLAGLWSRLLPDARVRRTDNFFELGGHSLLAIQLLARIREVFGLSPPLRVVFENPTLAGLAGALAGLQREAADLSAPPLVPVPRDRDLPLSFAQERLWFLDRLVPGSAAYNLTTALQLRRPPAPAVLAVALAGLTRRHEALRTRFGTAEGSPVQVIDPPGPAPLFRVDLSVLGSALARREAWLLAAAEAGRPFDLARGPLFRALACRLSPDEEWLVLNLHHSVSDGWSTGLLLRDLCEILEAAAAGREPVLPPLPLQYADFAAWQREWLRGETLERQAAYWRERLAGAPTLLEMPTDRPRPALQSFRGSSLPLPVGAVDAGALAATARRAGATGFMTSLAALGILLRRYSRQSDVLVGSPVANRLRPEVQDVIGLFVNTLVLRLELGDDPTVLELIARVRAGALGAYAHQDLPFEKLVEEVQPERSLGHQPLFQVMFTFQKMAPGGAQELGGPGGLVEVGNDSAKFDLNFGLTERDGRLAGVLEYCRDLFDRTTAQRLGCHFAAVLAGVAAGPERRLSELLLLAEGERHQVLVEWNDTRQPVNRRRIEAGFERQAAARPGALAVVDGDRRWSYGELDRFSDRLARHLRSLGIGPGDFVAVHLDRSLEMVAAVLGILKAGAAYLPVETSSPRPRMSFVLRQLGVHAAVTQSRRAEALLELPDAPGLAHVVCLDGAAPAAAPPASLPGRLISTLPPEDAGAAPERRPAAALGPEDIAYVIFTSGSTGTPKGVVVRHEPVVNLLNWVNETFAVGPDDSLLFVTSLSFDLSVYDVFGILAAGGSIRVAREDDVRDPARLAARLLSEPVTFWDSAPAALQQVVPFLPAAGAGGRLRALRLAFLSGDWVPVTLPDRLREAFPGAAVIALGGATEATVWSNAFPVGSVLPCWRSIPYGRPIRNARYHVLDEALEPSPVGVAGDLYIGGGCLASGYAAEPALTASKFLPDPFGEDAGGRLYQTGDRARYGADGNLEFLGRRDQQVKIRGFRVELGEIEAVLRQHPRVRESVAAVWDEGPGDRRLAVYVVLAGELEDLAGELRAFLQDRLPAYMVPAACIALHRLPTTPNGKLDRKALPRPGQERPRMARQAEPPRDAVERELAAVWEEVLGLRGLGVTDDFFELGGHSVLAVRLMTRIGQRFSRELPLSTLFRASTVRELAAELKESGGGGGSSLVEIRPGGSRAPLFCAHPVGGHVLCYTQLARHLPAERPVYGLEAVPRAGSLSLEEQAARHVAAIREVRPRGPYLLAGLSSGGVLAYEIARQLRQAGERVGLVALLDSRPPALGDHLDRLLEPVAFLMGLVREIEISSGRPLGLSADALRPLGEEERLLVLVERLRAAGLMPAELGVERVRELLDLLRDNQRAVETYRPAPCEGRVALFRASEDLTESLSGVDEEIRRVLTDLARHPSFGWDRFALSGIEIHPVPGNHLTMSEEPHVALLAERLEASLAAAEAGDGEMPPGH